MQDSVTFSIHNKSEATMIRILTLICFLSIQYLVAQEELPTFKPKHLDVYKAGYAFVVSEGTVTIRNSAGMIRPIPAGSFGTIWFGSDRARIEEVKSVSEYQRMTRPCRTLSEILRQQVSRQIVWRRLGEELSISGTLERVTDFGDRLLIDLKTGSQNLTLPVSEYNDYFEFPQGRIVDMTDSVRQEYLAIRSSGGSDLAFQMVYLQKGLGWTPSYRVDLLDDRNAQIVLSATLLNDAQDLEKTDLNFVVGFPHFLYSNIETPLTMKQTVMEFLNALSYAEGGSRPSYQRSALANQSVMYDFAEETSVTDFANMAGLEGSSEEDLFFYNLKNVSLKKGQRGQYNVFSAKVPYEHIYEVSLPSGLRDDVYYADRQETSEYPVWHSIKLENTTTNPWTTGSVITFQKSKSLGQDILHYAPVKASTNVKITQSPDIRIMEEEKETSRKEDVKKKDGYYYNQVTIDGEIVVQNFKSKEVRLTVTRPITGTILKNSDNPKIIQKASLYRAMNARNEVVWEVPVKAGETKKITYQYEALIRR